MKQIVKKFLDKLPYIKTLRKDVNTYKTQFSKYPPGHYYSPLPSMEEVLKRQEQIFDDNKKEMGGIDINEKEQLELLEELKRYYDDIPFGKTKKEKLRYWFDNE